MYFFPPDHSRLFFFCFNSKDFHCWSNQAHEKAHRLQVKGKQDAAVRKWEKTGGRGRKEKDEIKHKQQKANQQRKRKGRG